MREGVEQPVRVDGHEGDARGGLLREQEGSRVGKVRSGRVAQRKGQENMI